MDKFNKEHDIFSKIRINDRFSGILTDPVVLGTRKYYRLKDLEEDGYVVGYKAFNPTEYGLQCMDKIYKVNHIYDLNDELNTTLEMCNSGYHFCSDPWSTFNYYPQSSDNDMYNNPIILIVVALGTVHTKSDLSSMSLDKLVTDKILITDIMVDTSTITSAINDRFRRAVSRSPYKTYNDHYDLLRLLVNTRWSHHNDFYSDASNDKLISTYNSLTDLRLKFIEESRYGTNRPILNEVIINNNIGNRSGNYNLITNPDDLDKLLNLSTIFDPDQLIAGYQLDAELILTYGVKKVLKRMDKLSKVLSNCKVGHDFLVGNLTDGIDWISKLKLPRELVVRFTHVPYLTTIGIDTDDIDILIDSMNPSGDRYLMSAVINYMSDDQFMRLVDKIGMYRAFNSIGRNLDRELLDKLVANGYSDSMYHITHYNNWTNIDPDLIKSKYKLVLIRSDRGLLKHFKDAIIDEVGIDNYNDLSDYILKHDQYNDDDDEVGDDYYE